MSSLLKIVLIFVLFVGSITTVALLAGPEPAPAPADEPLTFDDLPTEAPPTVEPAPTEPPPPPARAPARAGTTAAEPEETRRPAAPGTGAVSEQSGSFSDGGECGGDSSVEGSAGNLHASSDDEEDC